MHRLKGNKHPTEANIPSTGISKRSTSVKNGHPEGQKWTSRKRREGGRETIGLGRKASLFLQWLGLSSTLQNEPCCRIRYSAVAGYKPPRSRSTRCRVLNPNLHQSQTLSVPKLVSVICSNRIKYRRRFGGWHIVERLGAWGLAEFSEVTEVARLARLTRIARIAGRGTDRLTGDF
jgi:hypothetical protein